MSTFPDLLQAALSAFREGRFPEAIVKARAALEVNATNEPAIMILAQALDASGDSAGAATALGEALKTGRGRPEMLYLQASFLRKSGKPAEALPFAEQFARIRPESSDAHAHLAVLLGSLGRHEEAAVAFKRAIRLSPTFAHHQYNLALTLLAIGKDSEALQVLSRLLTTWPDFAMGHVCLGEQLLKQGLHRDAAAAARSALSAQPDMASAHLLLARALADDAVSDPVGDIEREAEGHVKKAIELDPNSSAGHAMLGFALQERGQFESALAEFELSIRLNPRQGAVYYGLAMSRKYSGDEQELASRLKSLIQSDLEPTDLAYVHYALGKLEEDQRSFESALKQFDAANEIMFRSRAPQRPFNREDLQSRITETIGTFDADFIKRNTGIGFESELPLIVVGMMRSGTTLVEQILSSHPMVTGAGELMFWHENAGRAVSRASRNIDAAQGRRLAASYLDHLRTIGPNTPRVTDKMPQNTQFIGLIHSLFPNARIIHCRRHPVDTCLSIYATPYGTSPDFAHDRSNIVFAYQKYLQLMTHWRSVIPSDRFLEIDYEDLVVNRNEVTKKLIDFAGLEWDDRCLRHEENSRSVKTPSRWQVRQPIYGTSIARWQNYEPWLGVFASLLD